MDNGPDSCVGLTIRCPICYGYDYQSRSLPFRMSYSALVSNKLENFTSDIRDAMALAFQV